MINNGLILFFWSLDSWPVRNRKSKIQNLQLAAVVGTALLTLSFPAHAQQPTKIPRIGYLSGGSPNSSNDQQFGQGLRELGYAEGKNIAIEYRYADRKFKRLPDLVAELVRLQVNLIVTVGGPATVAAKNATSTIPIVMTNVTNPVAGGYVASLARPGGNVTGLTHMTGELSGKRLELLKEAFPKVSRVAFFINPDLANSLVGLREAEGVAGALGVKIQPRAVQASKDFEGALAAIAQEHDEALIIMGTSILIAHSTWIVNFARMHRLPAIYDRRRIVENGGLMSYGASLSDQLRRAATYVDKILKGAKPADLPVEQPTKFELVINLKEAKRTGLTVSPKVLRWADEVIK